MIAKSLNICKCKLCVCVCVCASFLLTCNLPTTKNGHKITSVIFHEVSYDNLVGPYTSPDYFRDIMEMIRLSGLKTVHVSNLVQYLKDGYIPKPNLIAITFDDGDPGLYEHAYPILDDYSYGASAFVFTDGIDSGLPRRCNWEQLREMHDTGVMEIHSHSKTHADLTQLDRNLLQQELKGSFNALRENGLDEPLYIAYPFGKYNEDVIQSSKEAGFAAGFVASATQYTVHNTPLYEIPRTTLCQFFNQDLICRKLDINLDVVRRKIIIFDDQEGQANNNWYFVDCTNNLNQGQLVNSYLISEQEAKWETEVIIQENGDYQLSLWLPLLDTNKDYGYQVQLFNNQESLIDNEFIISELKENGWNPIENVHIPQGNYKLVINSPIDEVSVLDGIKIEKIH